MIRLKNKEELKQDFERFKRDPKNKGKRHVYNLVEMGEPVKTLREHIVEMVRGER